MAKIRKMYPHADTPVCLDLMKLIETQSAETLNRWVYEYTVRNYLPVYLKYAETDAMSAYLERMKEYTEGKLTPKDYKPVIKQCRESVKGIGNPQEEIAARAICTAVSVPSVPASAFGFLLYGAMSTAYENAGLSETDETCLKLAEEELAHALQDLRAHAKENEENPVKVKWGC